MTKRRLLIVAHAPSPNTRRLLDAVVEGARSDEN
ncbi:MAG: flavodoxin family protein, partial [Alphaproteobacteria bacterium]